jgi:glycosyltransferase involved in cell wall biosynthesis
LTYNIVKEFDVPCNYVPHGIDPNEYIYFPNDVREINRKNLLAKKYNEDIFIVTWASRNIRRKNPSNIMEAFSIFHKKYKNSVLIMHTEPVDNDGTDLWRVHRDLFKDINIIFSTQKQPTQYLNALFNASDVVMSYSSAEGFGLTTCESLMSGTPIIVGLTGGLQDQINGLDGGYTGIGIETAAKTLVGSPPTPYIYEDHFNVDDYAYALESMYLLKKEHPEKIEELRKYCRKTAEEKFNIWNMVGGIDEGIQQCFESFKPRKPWKVFEA